MIFHHPQSYARVQSVPVLEHAAFGLWIGWTCFLLLACGACQVSVSAAAGSGGPKQPWLTWRAWPVRCAVGLVWAVLAYLFVTLSAYSYFEYWLVWPVAAYCFLLGVFLPEGFAYAMRRPGVAVIALGLPGWLKMDFGWELKQWWTCTSTIPESALQLTISGLAFLAVAFCAHSSLRAIVRRADAHSAVYLPQIRTAARRRRRRARILMERCLRRAGLGGGVRARPVTSRM